MANEKIKLDLEANFSKGESSLKKLKDELTGAKKSMESLQSSAKETERVLDKLEQLNVSKEFNSLSTSADKTKTSLSELKKESNNLNTLKKNTDNSSQSFRKLNESVSKNNQSLKSFNDTGSKSRGITSGLTSSILKASAGFLGLQAATQGVKSAIQGVVSATADFGKATSRVNTLTQATEKQSKALSDQARELGSTTEFAATQVAEGQQFLAQAGFETNEIIDSLGGTLNLASAGQLELAEAADIASNVLSGFGLEAEEAGRASDVLAQTSIASNTNVSQLGGALSKVAPIAANLGISVEETSAAIGQLGNAGIQGEEAGTGLRNIFISLANQTPKAKRALDDLGVSVRDSEGNIKSLTELTKEFGDANVETGELVDIFGKRAGPQFASLINQGSESLGNLTEKLNESGGTAERVAEDQLDNLAGDFTKLESATEGLQIAIGQNLNGSLRESTQFVTDFTGALTNLVEGQESTTEQTNALNKVLDRIEQIVPVLVALFLKFTAAGQRLATSFSTAGKGALRLGKQLRTSAGATRVAKNAFNAFKASLRSFAPLLIVEGIILLIQNFDKLKDAIFGVNEAERARKKVQKEVASETAKERGEAKQLFDELTTLTRGINDLTEEEKLSEAQTEKVREKQQERKELVDEINKQFPEFLGNLDAEELTLERIAEAREKVNQGLRDNARLKAAQEARQERAETQVTEGDEFRERLTGSLGGEESRATNNFLDRLQELNDTQLELTVNRKQLATTEEKIAELREKQQEAFAKGNDEEAKRLGKELERFEASKKGLETTIDGLEQQEKTLQGAVDEAGSVVIETGGGVTQSVRNLVETIAGNRDFDLDTGSQQGQEVIQTEGNLSAGAIADEQGVPKVGDESDSKDTEETKKNEKEKREAKKKTTESTNSFNQQIQKLEAEKQKRLNDIQQQLLDGEINEREARLKTLEVKKDVSEKELEVAEKNSKKVQEFRKKEIESEKALRKEREKQQQEKFETAQSNIKDSTQGNIQDIQGDSSLSEDEKNVKVAEERLEGLKKQLKLAKKFGEDEVELKRRIEEQKLEIERKNQAKIRNEKRERLRQEFEDEKNSIEVKQELNEVTREEANELRLEAEEEFLEKMRELKIQNGESVKQIDRDLALNQAKQKNAEVKTTEKGEQLKLDAVLQFAKASTAIAKLFGENSIAALIFEKSAAVAQTIVKGVVEIAEINRKFASNPPLAAALSTAAKIRTAVNVASIVATAIPSPPKIKEPGGGEGDEQGGGGGPQRTLAKGGILDGPSHAEGGIPMFSGGRQVAEAEGGEIVMTKGVASNPTLLKEASKINEAAGGSSLAPRTRMAEGGITTSGVNPAIAAGTVSPTQQLRALEEIANNSRQQPIVDVREITSTQRKVQALQNTGNL